MITQDKVRSLPTSPGVYLMKGATGEILYVGKARNLRQRVRSYFGSSRDSRYQIRFLLERVATLDVIVTDTEKEALILENTLIKQHRPRYNINLRDDKTYFSLRINLNDEFPRLTIVRKVVKDGASYFGPYASATAARSVLKQLYRVFRLRHYPLETCRRRKRPCLFYQIRQCSAPCHGLISREEYLSLAEGALLFLAGRNQDLVKVYRQRMAEAAAGEQYEEAGRYRDLLRNIETTLERQKVVTQGGDMDVVGLHREGQLMVIALLFIRGGTMIGSRNYRFSWELEDAEGVASFLGEYYGNDVFIPAEILLPLQLPEDGGLTEFLSERRGHKVTLSLPRRGVKAELVALASRNAATAATEQNRRDEEHSRVLEALRSRLHLSSLPHRIECYDISTFQGRHSVGSRVTFVDGHPLKEGYRRYRIRTVDQTDDFAMLYEVFERRIRRAAEEPLPDLIIVDGGLGQLGVLNSVLEQLGITGVEIAALAKSRVQADATESEISRSTERVFRPGRKNPIVLRQNSLPLLLLARIRDEAHRFAVTYHTNLRDRATLRSVLEEIPGIGRKTANLLLRQFGSLAHIRESSPEDFASLPGLSPNIGKKVIDHLRNPGLDPDRAEDQE
jgi:excinuclease ABC subunit C